MFIEKLFSSPVEYFTWAGVVVFSVCLHELSHAVSAKWQGDDTAQRRGYFTLNPMVHMGTPSLVMLGLIGIAWGLCPVDKSKLRHNYSDMLVSFAGPFANLCLMVVFSGIQAVLYAQGVNHPGMLANDGADFLNYVCELGAIVNGYLFLLNMLPVPPLDGFPFWSYFIPQVNKIGTAIGAGGVGIVFLLIIFGLGTYMTQASMFIHHLIVHQLVGVQL